MVLYINSKEFAEKLAMVSSVIPSKTIKEVLSCINFNIVGDGVLVLTATDLEIVMRHKLNGIRMDGNARHAQFNIDGSKIARLVGRFKSFDEIKLKLKFDGDIATSIEITAKGSKSKYTLRSVQENFPVVRFKAEASYKIADGVKFKNMLLRCAITSSIDELKIILNSVHFTFGEEYFEGFSVDGHRFTQAYFKPPSGSYGVNKVGKLIMPTKCVNSLVKNLSGDRLTISVGDNYVRVESGFLIYCKLCEGAYPNFKDLLPGPLYNKAVYQIDKVAFKYALENIEIFSSIVEFSFKNGSLLMRAIATQESISGEGSEEVPVTKKGGQIDYSMTFDVRKLLELIEPMDDVNLCFRTNVPEGEKPAIVLKDGIYTAQLLQIRT